MENKNVLLAVILSTAILIGWSFYFENPEEAQRKRAEIQGKTETQTSAQKPEAPQSSKINPAKSISRNEALKESDRVLIENKNLSGSISLRGALIDDIILKNYRETLDANSKPIVLLSPKNMSKVILWNLVGQPQNLMSKFQIIIVSGKLRRVRN